MKINNINPSYNNYASNLVSPFVPAHRRRKRLTFSSRHSQIFTHTLWAYRENLFGRFKSLNNSKAVLKSLEKISDHGATFGAALMCFMAVGIRPLAICLSPDVDKENKQYAVSNSIASGLIKFGMFEAIALPVENALKKIDKNPEKFIKTENIDKLKNGAASFSKSENYNTATQILKQGTGFVTAIPKAMLTIALIPPLMNLLFSNNKKQKQNFSAVKKLYKSNNPIFDSFEKNSSPSFKGLTSNAALKGTSAILNNNYFLNLVDKLKINESNIAKNISIATDILLTGAFAVRTKKDKKIDENRKKPLIYNNIISTGITLAAGYKLDEIVKKNTSKSLEKFIQANKNDPKLNKYIQGINILRPNLIFAGLYYVVLPIFSTFLADKIDKHFSKTAGKAVQD